VYEKISRSHLKIHSIGAYIYSCCRWIIWQKEKGMSSVSYNKMACLVSYYKMTRIISLVITEMLTSLQAIRWRARYNFKHAWECRKIRVLWQSVNSVEGNQVITRLSESVSNGKSEYERRLENVTGDEVSYAFYEITPCRYTHTDKNPKARNFLSPEPEVTCGPVAIVIRVILLSPYLRIRGVSLSSINYNQSHRVYMNRRQQYICLIWN
jgi:hypothetical protein